MYPVRIKISPAAASTTTVAASQSPGTAALTLTTAGKTAIDPAALPTGAFPTGLGRILTITSGGNDTGITFAIVGFDQNGLAASEAVTGASGGVAVSTLYYTKITSITPSAAVASTVSVGIRNTTASALLATIPIDFYKRIAPVVQVDVTGTISYTVQMTFDDCLGSQQPLSNAVFFATPATPTALSTQSASKYDTLVPCVTGLQISIPTYSTNGSILVNIVSPSNSTTG